MECEWDERKNRSNIKKHGFSFSFASRIFDEFTISRLDDRRDYGEVRKHTIGRVGGLLVIAVIHTDRADKIRIISARRADKDERKSYEKALHKRADH